MKKVVLLGDSIRQSYWVRVKELLSDIAEVYAPAENCAYTLHTIRRVRDWFNTWGHADLIHYNNGAWDHHRDAGDGMPLSSPEQYLYLNRRLYKYLSSMGDKLIWATTTPAGINYREEMVMVDRETWNDEVKLYNEIMVAYMKHQGVEINDIHSLVWSNVEKYICADSFHLSPEGVEAVAQQTAAHIRRVLTES